MKITGTVLILASLAACTTPAKDHPAGSAPSAPLRSQPPAAAQPEPQPTPTTATAAASPAVASASAVAPGAGASLGSGAYAGCGAPIPLARLWDETTEGEVLDAISAAKACAAEHGRRLLLEFVAPWCEDCQEMAKLDETAIVAATLKSRFERVRVNVGKWDRHEALRKNFDVHVLATYIVIDPKTSQQLAKTTLEPITKKGQKLSAEQWAAWLAAH